MVTLATDDFVNLISRYDLGTYSQSKAMGQGSVQTNFFVQTTEGKFVLKFYDNRSKESVLFETHLLTYLTEHHYPCPTPLKNRQGTCVGIYHNKPYVLFAFIESRHIEHLSAYHKEQLIQKVAQLQKLTKNYRSPYTAHRWNYHPDLCRTLAHAEATRINNKNAHEKFAWLAHELLILDLPHSLPKGISHCDFHFSNVLFQEDQFVALLDFDDANYTFLQFDLVSLIDSWAWAYGADMLDVVQARWIVQEYMKHRRLTTIEQQHMYDVYKLSVLIDCVWFFGRGQANDFYEKRKIDALNHLGRQRFIDELFHK